MSDRPLFIPLARRFYEAFADGSKRTELRKYGPRWNDRTCVVGRPVVISLGYGKEHRRSGVIASVQFLAHAHQLNPGDREAFIECYGDPDQPVIEIGIDLEEV